jgi:hypothetical protein
MNNMDQKDQKSLIAQVTPAIIIGLVATATRFIPEPSISVALVIGVVVLYGLVIFVPQIATAVNEMLKQKIEGQIAVAQIQNEPQSDSGELFNKLHDFVHLARDTSVKSLPVVPKYSDLIPSHLRSGSQLPKLKSKEVEYNQLLIELYHVFRLVIPAKHKIWVAIRDRRSDNQYHTWLRHGSHNKSRSSTTQPMHKDTHQTVIQLKRHYYLQRKCVRITGIHDPEWQEHKNDKLNEDQSVMMGAVMTRSWGEERGEWQNNCLSLILTVNSPDADVFDRSHIPLLQAAIDTFSWLTNTTMREQYEENKTLHPTADSAPV